MKKLGKSLFIQIAAFGILIGGVTLASSITFPTSTPAGQTAGGKFQTYFNEIYSALDFSGTGLTVKGNGGQTTMNIPPNDGFTLPPESEWPTSWGGGLRTWDVLASAIKTIRGIVTEGGIQITNHGPTIYLQDTNNKSALINTNGGYFYILGGAGTGSTIAKDIDGWWPMAINLENNSSYFGGNMTVNGTITASTPTATNHVATKSYVDTKIANIPAGPTGPQGIKGLKGDKGDTGPAGTAILSCITKVKTFYTEGNIQCDYGYIMTGGGCSGNENYSISMPESNGWKCRSENDGTSAEVYARCCK